MRRRSPPAGGRPRSGASRGSSTTSCKTADGVSPVLSAIDVVAVARDVHRALRAAARPVPVPAEPQDPGRAGGARGRRDRRRCRACRTRSATSSAAAAAPPTWETSHEPQRRLVRPVHPDHRRLPDPRRLRHGRRHPAPAAGARPTSSGGPSSTASARSGTATRSGWCSAAASCSPSSRWPTRRCSRASTSRSCWSCSC